jgi:hypothetical protein
VEELEDRTLLNGSPLQSAVPLNLNPLNQAQTAHVLSQLHLASVSVALPTLTSGTIHHANQVDTYSFTISSVQGEGNLTADVAAPGGTLLPRLTLSGPQGEVLIQSDSGRIVLHLQPGTYSLSVSSQAGTGSYRLTASFTPAGAPLAPLPAGTVTRSVALGDFNGDGTTDVATANFLDGTISVMLGNGDGTFQPQIVIPTGPGPASVTAADVNGDGKLDLITANKFNGTLSVLLGNGNGTFQPEMEFAVGNRPGGVAVADFNGDGKPDLAVSNYRDGTISVLLGNGNGTFQAQQTYATDPGPGKVETADINGDGIPDLITPNYSGGDVSVLLGKGNGTFQPQQTFATGRTPYSVAIGDINGDGIPDLAVTNYVDNNVSVLLGLGNGTFAPQKTFSTGTEPYSVALADVNGDGKLDLVTSNFGDNSVSVLLGQGDGTFGAETIFPAGTNPRVVALGDLNGDGAPDIVTANVGDHSVSVLLGRGDGTFSAQQAALAPAPGQRPFSVVVADLNNDGRNDIVTADKGDNSVSVLLSNSDGSFQTRETYDAGPNPNSVAIGDVNGDGFGDIVIANYTGKSVSVLLNNGDGTFGPPTSFATGNTTYAVTLADVNGDGKLDIITANKGDSTVSVLLGNGDGTFQAQQTFAAGKGVDAVAVRDVNGDGKPDIVAANFGDGTVSILLNNGNGTFAPQQAIAVGSQPSGVKIEDVNGDGKMDIVTSNYGGNSVSVLLGNGNGTFQPKQDFAVGSNPDAVAIGDFNGDHKMDIATANFGSGDVSVLLGNGNGTFGPAQNLSAGSGTSALALADLNGDSKLDIAATNRNDGTVSVLFGNGSGAFQPKEILGLTQNRYSVAVADVNGDGKPDIIKTNLRDGTIAVELGDGTGAFQQGQIVAVGSHPTSVKVADVNGDGRLDLVTTNSADNSVSVLLGNGDGTFNVEQTFAVGRSPRNVVVADVNGDGIKDLVVSNYNDNSVSVLLGKGDGSFAPQKVINVGQKPYALSVADVNGDHKPDLIVANAAGDTVSVLLGDGAGNFAPQQTFAAGRQPIAVTVADVNGDHIPDVITANTFDGTVSVLLGNGNGTFQPQQVFMVGKQPSSIEAVDLNGDGKIDLVTSNYGDNHASVLLGNGNGTFQTQQLLTTNLSPVQTIAADVNGDGRPDLVTVGNHDDTIGVLLSKGGGAFQTVTAATDVSQRDTPFLADLNGDGIADSIVLDRSGNILFREGLPGTTGDLAPPVILNPNRPARDIAILRTGTGLAIAAADAHFDPALSTSQFVFTVSLYTVSSTGLVTRSTAFSTTSLPARLAAADLTGAGRDDLIAINPLDNSVSIALQTTPGHFAAPITVSTGIAPSDITTADTNGDGRPDILVSDQSSGDVTVLLNDVTHSFAKSLRFRAGTQPNTLDTSGDVATVSSLAQSVSLAAGDFTGDGIPDLVVVNRGAHSFTVLPGDGHGGFLSPRVSLTTSTSDGFSINDRPGAVVAGDFNGDGKLDLAVLMEDTGQLWIYTGNGNGTFHHTFSIPVGDQATGLTVVKGTSGFLDLLVGNGFGDELHLEGKGDGTFQISGKRVSLSVVPDLLGPGQAGVLVGNQEANRVTVQAPTSGGSQFIPVQTLGANPSAQLAPGDVEWAMLDKSATLPDAVVVSTGSNAVVVYHTTAIANGVPVFAPTATAYFVGTAPAGVTVADLNGDGIMDMLIADQGSNDVSVLFGSYDAAGDWVGTPGPRLKSGGDGPLSMTLRDLNGDSIPDLVITNGASGTVAMLPGVGKGFFDDRSPKTLLDFGAALVQPTTFVGDSGVGYAVTAGGELLRFDLGNLAAGVSVAFAGPAVLAARALANGQVVAALAGGAVDLLTLQGGVLNVTAELSAQAGVPVEPSSLEVLQMPGGQLQVLVSSQGSDTIFVYGSTGAGQLPVVGGGSQQAGPASAASNLTVQVSIAVVNGIATSISGSGESSGAAIALGANSAAGLTAPLGSTGGQAISGFAPGDRIISTTEAGALLAPIQGSAYAVAAVLDFGVQVEEADGAGRKPWLSTDHPIGDTSPLTRFVIGQEEALREHRNTGDMRLPDAAIPVIEPWLENLFRRFWPLVSPPHDQQNGNPMGAAPAEDAFWQKCSDDPGFLSWPFDSCPEVEFEALAVILAGLLLEAPRVNRRWAVSSAG